MKEKLQHHDFCLFKLKGPDELHVAVPISYMPVIEEEISKNGDIASVPSDKTVRAIFLYEKDGELVLDENAQQNDILINQLIIL